MSDIKAMAFSRGMAMLAASGAVYAVVHEGVVHTSKDAEYALLMPDGTVHGSLPIVQPKSRKSRASNEPRRDWKHTGYIDQLKALQVGEMYTYKGVDKAEAQQLQRAATGTAGKLWGPSNFISTVTKENTLEILRVV